MRDSGSRTFTRKYLPVLVGAAVVLGACSRAASPPATSTPTTLKPSTSGTGCDKPASPGTVIDSFRIAGRARTVIVHVPTGYTGAKSVALVLNLHGSGGDAVEEEGLTGMDATSDADDFVVAYPQGFIKDGTGFDWNVPGVPLFGGRPVPANAPDDVSFLVSLIGVLKSRYCIDSDRVYSTGISGGGRMSSQLACDASNVFAAVAPVSGLRRPLPCPTTRAVPIISFHGTADPIDPYNGHGQAYWTYSVPQAEKYWDSQDGCSATPVTSRPVATVTVTVYEGCRDGAVVELYTIAGEGHEWPGGPHLRRAITRVLGPQTTAISADQLMWSFFAAHPMSTG